MKSMEPEPSAIDQIPIPIDGQHVGIVNSGADDCLPNQPTSPYSILSETEKKITIIMASMVNILTFLSANIYYPALGPLSEALNVSEAKINLSITTYLIFQGLVPLLTGNLSDQKGRRPMLLMCLLIFIATNIGLALQTNYVALLVLRSLQSFGCSGAMVVCAATIVDLVTRAERGKYMAYISVGATVGPAIGPILGGVLLHFMGWRSIFWFLAVSAGALALMIVFFLRETCRAVVGNGSLPPQPWNRSVLDIIRPQGLVVPDYSTCTVFHKRPGILDSIKIVANKQIGLLILFRSLLFCGVMAVLSSIPALMEEKYGFSSLQVGLTYIPFAVGGIAARWTVGTLADWNFKRHSRRVGLDVQRNRQSKAQLQMVPLEKARLEITLPLVYLCSLCIIAYGWVMVHDVHISGPLVMLFFLGNTITGAGNMVTALVMDLNTYRPAMTMAAMTMFRFLPSAGVAAAVLPLIGAVGIGWVGTIVAGVWFIASPGLWFVYFHGRKWRQRDITEPRDTC